MYVVQNCINNILLRKVPRVFILCPIERNVSCKVVFCNFEKTSYIILLKSTCT